MKYSINAPQAPEAPGAYSMGTTAGRLIFTAGQIALDPTDPSKVVSGGARAEVERIIEIITILLAECGCTLSDVAKSTLYLTNFDDLEAVEEAISRHFVTPAPALSVVEVTRLPRGALVEMDCIACR